MNILNKVTLKMLKKNKIRTIVTIIGIILSTAMVTAVTTGVSSYQNMLYKITKDSIGDWYGNACCLDYKSMENIINDKKIADSCYLANLGFADIGVDQNGYTRFLSVAGLSNNFKDMMSLKISSGKFPENTSEIILPDSLNINYGNLGANYKIGQKIELKVGDRQLITSNEPDDIVNVKKQEYTVVGFYKRPGYMRDYSNECNALEFNVFTVADNNAAKEFDLYFKTEDPKDIYNYIDDNLKDEQTEVNNELLRTMLSSNDVAANDVVYVFGAILLAIISLGTISLINNAFSMSVSERTKQFGVLSSVGATKKQLLKSVIFEAMFLCLIGIPIGLLSGIGGLGITLKCTEGIFNSLSDLDSNINFTLSVSWQAIVAAVIVTILTVLISTYIPARRASKISAIDAIRLSKDIKIKRRQIKTSKLTYKLFGFEGMLASKNFKRNRKKYRATVLSLFMSVVLFITASSFTDYFNKGIEVAYNDCPYDIRYDINGYVNNENQIEFFKLYDRLNMVDGIKQTNFAKNLRYQANISQSIFKEDTLKALKEAHYIYDSFENQSQLPIYLNFVSDDYFKEYLKDNSLNEKDFMDKNKPKAVVMNKTIIKKRNDNGIVTKISNMKLLNKNVSEISTTLPKKIDGYKIDRMDSKQYVYQDEDLNEKYMPENESSVNVKFNIGAVVDKQPLNIFMEDGTVLILTYPYSVYDTVMQGVAELSYQSDLSAFFKAENHKKVYQEMQKIALDNGFQYLYLQDVADSFETNRALIKLVNIFAKGFIILISLIAIANVFNTISTNIILRRQEFAMLKSVGMTKRGFNKIMNFECLLYGIKGVIFGIPVSIITSFLMYQSLVNELELEFYIPVKGIVIAVGSVFVVVFATMLYAMRKIKEYNPIDALKDENI